MNPINQPTQNNRRYGTILTLPDKSEVILDYSCYSFEPVGLRQAYELCEAGEYISKVGLYAPALFTAYCRFTRVLIDRIEKPQNTFAECFRRYDTQATEASRAFFYIRRHKAPVDVFQLASFYKVERKSWSMMYTPMTISYNFCDGGLGQHFGYGFGPSGQTYYYVRGLDALRAVCLFFGIKQPRYLKGLEFIKSDAEVLVSLTQTVDVGASHPSISLLSKN